MLVFAVLDFSLCLLQNVLFHPFVGIVVVVVRSVRVAVWMLLLKFLGHIVISAVFMVARIMDVFLYVVVLGLDLTISVHVVERSVVMTRGKRNRARRELLPLLVGPVSKLVDRHIEAGHSQTATNCSQTGYLQN